MALANARRAPNADYVEQLLGNKPQLRYSTNIEEDSLLDVVSRGFGIFGGDAELTGLGL